MMTTPLIPLTIDGQDTHTHKIVFANTETRTMNIPILYPCIADERNAFSYLLLENKKKKTISFVYFLQLLDFLFPPLTNTLHNLYRIV